MPNASDMKLSQGFTAVTIVLAALLLAACAEASPRQQQSLKAGQAQAALCVERLHDGLADFIECVQYVADNPPHTEPRRDWWALGALHYGWLLQDLTDADAGEHRAQAQALVLKAEQLRLRLKAPDTLLCPLIDIPCATQQRRRQERLAGR